MTRRSRIYFYGPILFVGVMLIAWRMLWNAGVDEIRSTLRRAADRLAEIGVVMTYEPLTAHGFPFALKGHSDDVSFSGPRRRILTDRLRLNVSIFRLDRVQVLANRVELAGDGEFWTIDGDMRGSIARDPVRDWMIRGKSESIAARRGDLLCEIGAVDLEAGPDEVDKARIRATLAVDNVSWRGAAAKIDRIEATIGIEPATADPPTDGAAARQLTIRGMKMQFDGATLTGSGLVHVMPGGDVEGVVDACVDRPEKLARLAREAGALGAADAAKAAAALALASRLSKDGSLCAPIEMRKGAVSIAGVVIAKY